MIYVSVLSYYSIPEVSYIVPYSNIGVKLFQEERSKVS